MNRIQTALAPTPVGPYSQAIEAGGIIYCSGSVGLNPTTSKLVDGGIEEQTKQALMNLSAVLQEAGSSLKSVLKTTVLIRDMADFPLVNSVYLKIFSEAKGEDSPMPARTTFAVAGLPLNALVEIDCTALQVIRARPLGALKAEKIDSAAKSTIT
jgi:2-iminobutanoate/2-iminopropanoate deaminase